MTTCVPSCGSPAGSGIRIVASPERGDTLRLETHGGPRTWRLRDPVQVLGEWRVIYVAKFAEAVYVLHAFQKKTQRTRRQDIELARRRY